MLKLSITHVCDSSWSSQGFTSTDDDDVTVKHLLLSTCLIVFVYVEVKIGLIVFSHDMDI